MRGVIVSVLAWGFFILLGAGAGFLYATWDDILPTAGRVAAACVGVLLCGVVCGLAVVFFRGLGVPQSAPAPDWGSTFKTATLTGATLATVLLALSLVNEGTVPGFILGAGYWCGAGTGGTGLAFVLITFLRLVVEHIEDRRLGVQSPPRALSMARLSTASLLGMVVGGLVGALVGVFAGPEHELVRQLFIGAVYWALAVASIAVGFLVVSSVLMVVLRRSPPSTDQEGLASVLTGPLFFGMMLGFIPGTAATALALGINAATDGDLDSTVYWLCAGAVLGALIAGSLFLWPLELPADDDDQPDDEPPVGTLILIVPTPRRKHRKRRRR